MTLRLMAKSDVAASMSLIFFIISSYGSTITGTSIPLNLRRLLLPAVLVLGIGICRSPVFSVDASMSRTSAENGPRMLAEPLP